MISAVFAKDSTGMLVKKYMVYKLMSSNLFINYSLGLMNIFYKILGVNLTNLCINKSVGSLFTSGESISTLVADIKALEKSNIYGIGNYVVEGLATMDDEFIQGVMDHMMESIHAQTEGKEEGHFAIKLTALISMDVMTRLSRAQQVFKYHILKNNSSEYITADDVNDSLQELGIALNDQELS